MTTYSHSHTFQYPFPIVTTAFWLKYPNPNLPHIKEALVLSREIDENGILKTKRLMCVKQEVPRVLKPLVIDTRLDTFYALETCEVDAKDQILTLKTRNLSFARILDAQSFGEYRGLSNGTTNFTTSSIVKCSVFFVGKKVEDTLSTGSLKNSLKGISVMEALCHSLVNE
jgi:hypothetical protein